MTTREDLNWWLDLASTLEWTFATTYAKTAPHSYVVHGRTAGMSRDDYVRAAHVIHTFGVPQKFYAMTNIYLTSPDGRLKWWTMDPRLADTGLINQATTDRLYGVQNAPNTHSGLETPRDAIATTYDEAHPLTDDERTALHNVLIEYRSEYPPAVLDVMCGTGRILDLRLTSPDRYAGVDPSQPMLNMLVRKHPNVAAIYPTTVQQVLAEKQFTPQQFEIVTAYDASAELATSVVSGLARLASRALVLRRRGGALEVIDCRAK